MRCGPSGSPPCVGAVSAQPRNCRSASQRWGSRSGRGSRRSGFSPYGSWGYSPDEGLVGGVREVAMAASTFAAVRALELPRELPATRRRWLPTPRATPFAFVYVALLAAGSIVLSVLDTGDHDAILKFSSTDVDHLSRHPLFVLVSSAFWVDGVVDSIVAILVLGIVATLLERRIGTRWVVAIFASGHVGATLLTEGSVALGVHYGMLPATATSRLDVGASYGLAAMLGAAAGLLPRPVRTIGVIGGWAYLGWPIASGRRRGATSSR